MLCIFTHMHSWAGIISWFFPPCHTLLKLLFLFLSLLHSTPQCVLVIHSNKPSIVTVQGDNVVNWWSNNNYNTIFFLFFHLWLFPLCETKEHKDPHQRMNVLNLISCRWHRVPIKKAVQSLLAFLKKVNVNNTSTKIQCVFLSLGLE